MPNILITDIDGTVIEYGEPIGAVLEFIDQQKLSVFVLTYRNITEKARTVEDLKRINLNYDQLIMNNTDLSAAEFKKEEANKLLKEGYNVNFFIDNDKSNRNSVGSLGIETIDPNDLVDNYDQKNVKKVSKKYIYMTIEQELSNKCIELNSAIIERDEIRVAMENLVSKESVDLKGALEKVETLSTDLDKLNAEKTELLKQVEELQKNKISASMEAAKIVASVGVSPVEVSPVEDNSSAKKVTHLETFLSMQPGYDRTSYYAKYKNEIIRGI